MTHTRTFRLIAALIALAAFSGGVPHSGAQDNDTIKEAKEKREDARRAQLQARIELEYVAAEDLEVVEALNAATELVNLQQAKIDAANQRLTAAAQAREQAEVALLAAGSEVELLREQTLRYAVESYVGFDERQRTEAWLDADNATIAAHKVALLDAVSTETFDVVDQLRAIEERRAELLADAEAARAETDEITAGLADALGELEANQARQAQLKAEVDKRRERWETALANAEQEEADLTAKIKAEEERIERELERARLARLAAASPVNPNLGIVSDGGWTWPTAGGVASVYGQRLHPILGYYRLHSGIDVGGAQGQEIWAAHDGIIQLAGWNGGYGNTIVIAHGESTTTLYAHMSGFAVSVGEYVQPGQLVGYVGSTGLSTGPHLHYEIHREDKKINPLKLKLPSGEKLAGKELERFAAHSAALTEQFAALGDADGPTMLACADGRRVEDGATC